MKYKLKLDITLPTLFYRKGQILNNIEVSILFRKGVMDTLAFSDIFEEYLDEYLGGEPVEEAPEPPSEEIEELDYDYLLFDSDYPLDPVLDSTLHLIVEKLNECVRAINLINKDK